MVAAGPDFLEAGDLAPVSDLDMAIQSSSSKAKAVTIYIEAHDDDNKLVLERVEKEVALLSPYMQKQIVTEGLGVSEDNPIRPPKGVNLDILRLLMEYCDYHRLNGRSDKERKAHDERYIRMETRRLCELTSAADALEMKPLVDLASKALARLIEGKSPDQIRSTFHLPDDLSEEEKLEPIKNLGEDSRIRLLNRLYAKRREQELSKKKGEQDPPAPPPKTEQQQDTRSVDELLNFIEADEREKAAANAKAAKASSNGSTKAKRKRNKKRTSSEQQASDASASSVPLPGHTATTGSQQSSPGATPAAEGQLDGVLHGAMDVSASQDLAEESEDCDPDADQEVEELQRRLGTGWEARQQELLSFAHAAASQPRFTTLPSLAAFKQRMAAPPSTPAPAPSLNAHPQGAADGSAQPGPACSNELLVAPTAAEDSMPPASNSLQPSQPDTAAAAHTPSDSEQAAAAAPPAAADLELDTDQTATEVHPHVDADSRQASSQGTADGSGSTRVDNVKTDELHEVFRQHDADENIASSAADSRQQESAASAPISAAVNDAAVHARAAQQAVAEGVQQGGSSNVVSSDDDSTAVSDEQKPSLAVHTPDQTGDRPSLAKRIIGRFIGAAMGTGSISSNTSSPKCEDAKNRKGSDVHPSQPGSATEPPESTGSVEEAATGTSTLLSTPSTASAFCTLAAPHVQAPGIGCSSAASADSAEQCILESTGPPSQNAGDASQHCAPQHDRHPIASFADAQAAMQLLQAFLQQAGLSQHLRLTLSADQTSHGTDFDFVLKEPGLNRLYTNGHASLSGPVMPPVEDGSGDAADNAVVVRGRLPGGADMRLHLAATPSP